MNIFSEFTKSSLELLIKNIFLKFGNISTCKVMDSIKILGFFYATAGGISISIEDLKNSLGTENILSFVTNESSLKTLDWEEGKISDLERFEIILNSWNLATEYIKDEIILYYKKFDPLNCLYLMSNSGARGNMSQVRQLIGLRGLMSDQQGNVIDIPIHTSFSKGLTTIDYIISAYGARKGIVDTAIKTANAGYLTRRLIFLTQNIVIRSINCNTENGITLQFNNRSNNYNTILGRYLVDIKNKFNQNINIFSSFKNSIITKDKISLFNLYNFDLYIKIRTISNCKNKDSICQKCYGYDLALHENIQLGEVVGIIAAQSVGEPGTQLTMRTFHTGGVFTAQITNKSKISLSAKMFVPKNLIRKKFRTEYEMYLNKLLTPISIILMEWFGKKSKMEFRPNYYLPFDTSKICYKNDYIGEEFLKKSLVLRKKLKPFIIKYDTEIYTKTLSLISIPTNLTQYRETILPEDLRYSDKKCTLTLSNEKRVISLTKGSRKKCYLNTKNGYLSLKIGKIISINKNFQNLFNFYVNKYKAIAKAKFISTVSGIINIINNNIIIITLNCRYSLNILELIQKSLFSNQKIYLFISVQKYQYIDQYSKIFEMLLVPKFSEKLYRIQKYKNNFQTNIFVSGNFNIWNVFYDINKKILNNNNKIINYKKCYNQLLYSKNKGIFLKKDGSNFYFENFLKFFIEKGNILNLVPKNTIFHNTIIGKSLTSPIQGNDIVQGLPKVEQIITATHPKLKHRAILSNFPGKIISAQLFENIRPLNTFNLINNNLYTYSLRSYKENTNILKKNLYIKHSSISKNTLIFDEMLEKKLETWLEKRFPNIKEKRKYYNRHDENFDENIYSNLYSKLDKLDKTFANKLWEYQNANSIILNKINKNNTSLKMLRKKYKEKLMKKQEDIFKIMAKRVIFLERISNTNKNEYNSAMKKLEDKTLELLFELYTRYIKLFVKALKRKACFYIQSAYILNNIGKKLKIKLLILRLGRDKFFFQHPNFPKNISIINKKFIFEDKFDLYNYLYQSVYTPIFFKKELKSQLLFNKKLIPYILKEPITKYSVPKRLGMLFKANNYVNIGEPLSKGYLDPHKLLFILHNYYFLYYDNISIALTKSVNKFRLILINSLISVYEPQGVKIALKHIELISKQLTNKALVSEFNYTKLYYVENDNILTNPFLPNEEINISAAISIYNNYKNLKQKFYNIQLPMYIPLFRSSINVGITRPGFLSSASFQHTKRVLIKASLVGTTDWLTGLKERVITGKFFPGGTTYRHTYSTNLNKNQFYKNI